MNSLLRGLLDLFSFGANGSAKSVPAPSAKEGASAQASEAADYFMPAGPLYPHKVNADLEFEKMATLYGGGRMGGKLVKINFALAVLHEPHRETKHSIASRLDQLDEKQLLALEACVTSWLRNR